MKRIRQLSPVKMNIRIWHFDQSPGVWLHRLFSQHASAQAVTSKWQLSPKSPVNTNSSGYHPFCSCSVNQRSRSCNFLGSGCRSASYKSIGWMGLDWKESSPGRVGLVTCYWMGTNWQRWCRNEDPDQSPLTRQKSLCRVNKDWLRNQNRPTRTPRM